jgi:hypothetical protein
MGVASESIWHTPYGLSQNIRKFSDRVRVRHFRRVLT